MDWDCKGMHLHLMAIAWQQEKKGYLLDDDKIIKKLLGNPEETDWNERIKPQIFQAWKKEVVNENGLLREYWYQPGILKTTEQKLQNAEPVAKKTRAKKKKLIENFEGNPEYDGFDLKLLLDAKPTTTILHETANAEQKSTIWNLGVQLVKRSNDSEATARRFIGKLIKQYGDKTVAEAIAQLSVKSVQPADPHSYLTGILNKQQIEDEQKTRGTGKGRVSL
jgi:hypothetical protein